MINELIRGKPETLCNNVNKLNTAWALTFIQDQCPYKIPQSICIMCKILFFTAIYNQKKNLLSHSEDKLKKYYNKCSLKYLYHGGGYITVNR